MLHTTKGTIPLRLSGINSVKLENIKIQNIKNLSNFGQKHCGNYNYKTSFQNSRAGFFGADIRGVTIENCNGVDFINVSLEGFWSESGRVLGVDVMFESRNVRGGIVTKGLQSGGMGNLPDDFYDVPQSLPGSFSAVFDQDSDVEVLVRNDFEGGAFFGGFIFGFLVFL